MEYSDHEKFDLIVYTIKSENILSYLSDIEREISGLVDEKKDVHVLFDTLLYSSNSSERFIEAQYSKGEFDNSSFEFIPVPKKDLIRQSSLEFFQSHHEIIKSATLLNSIQKKIILKGIPI